MNVPCKILESKYTLTNAAMSELNRHNHKTQLYTSYFKGKNLYSFQLFNFGFGKYNHHIKYAQKSFAIVQIPEMSYCGSL